MIKRGPVSMAENWSHELADPTNWLPVRTCDMPAHKRVKYLARKNALETYLLTDTPISSIVKNTGVSRSEIFRVSDRAYSCKQDGTPVGFMACVPGYRIKQYTRTSQSDKGKAGTMTQFLEANPDIRELLDAWALGKKKIGSSVAKGKGVKGLWLAFVGACNDAGVDTTHHYPFTNTDGGREAVRRYVKTIRDSSFSTAAKIEHGDDAGRLASRNGENVPTPTVVPYERVQLDGHEIDCILNVSMLDPQGNLLELPLSRIWLIVLIDNASRCVLGYSLSLHQNYTSEDVLNCIGSSLEPWSPKTAPESVNPYKQGSGLPSGVIDQCAWRVFNTIQYDNAKSHLSAWVQERILSMGALEVVSIKPKSPRSDSIVERFMRTFELYSMHKFPNTTGSNPQDPLRKKPEKEAKRLKIGLDELELIVDMTMANYNVEPHPYLNGRSPVEYLQYRLSIAADLVRHAPNRTLDDLGLFERDYPRKIRASSAQGHKPYISFMGVRYTSDTLRDRYDLKDKQTFFRVCIKDIRSGILMLESGECIGRLDAEPRWMELPHSISDRRSINALIKQKKLRSESMQPVRDLLRYYEEQAVFTRKGRNKLLRLERSHTQTSKNKSEHSGISEPKEKIAEWRSKGNKIKLTRTHSR